MKGKTDRNRKYHLLFLCSIPIPIQRYSFPQELFPRERERKRERERERERDRQTDRQTDRQAGRQAGRRTDGRTDGHRQTDRQTDRQTEKGQVVYTQIPTFPLIHASLADDCRVSPVPMFRSHCLMLLTG